jgi:hypothetical protein
MCPLIVPVKKEPFLNKSLNAMIVCSTRTLLLSLHPRFSLTLSQDPHVPKDGRFKIWQTLEAANVNFTWHEFNGQHAFMRDEGPRYDPELALQVYGLLLGLFRRKLGEGCLVVKETSNQLMMAESRHWAWQVWLNDPLVFQQETFWTNLWITGFFSFSCAHIPEAGGQTLISLRFYINSRHA